MINSDCNHGQASGEAPSNVLVILCDQLRRDLLGCYGGTQVRTPHIDALARDAMVFDRAYTPTAICSPARASLVTGVYPHTHHMFNNSTPGYSYCEHLREDLTTLQSWVDDETDYESAYFGKWHIGPAADLFNSRFHHKQKPEDGDWPFMHSSHWHPGTYLGPLTESWGDGRGGLVDVPMDGFPDVVAANYTIDYLKNRRDVARPFMAFCAFPGPHSPWMLPAEFGIRYDPADIPIWPGRNDTFEGKPLFHRKLNLQERCPGHHSYLARGDDQLRELLACNFSYIELIDGQVGEVIAELRAQGLYDSTTIVFTADHGDMAGNHGFLNKGCYMYDDIYRIPLLVKPAGKPAPKRIAAPVHLMDVTATLVHQISGTPSTALGNQEMHGRSLLEFASDAPNWDRTHHYAEYHGDWYGHYSSRMVTDGRWKLVWNLTDLCELYDIDDDPSELRNRFRDPACREVRDALFQTLLSESRRLNDPHPRLYQLEVEDLIWESVTPAPSTP